ncbi:MAG: hypothetical protein D6B25_18295, partial [Desulfobulbaceae bacterium]
MQVKKSSKIGLALLISAVVTSVFCHGYALGSSTEGGAEVDAPEQSVIDLSNEVTDPRWEIGLIGFGGYLPYYKGSSENRPLLFAFPYVVYRGEIISLDDESITGLILDTETFTLDLAVYGEVNKNDDAREGMDELDAIMMAVGPSLNYYFARKASAGHDLYLSLSVRGAITGDWDDELTVDYRGIQSKLILTYENYELLPKKQLELIAGVSLSAIDSELAGYFYDVAPRFATADRPAFDADGGYAGASISLDLKYHVSDR